MVAKRAEPSRVALAELRRRLAAGDYRPGARLAAADLAAEFGLSPTPLREALARLCGEGILEDRRGLGVFVPRLLGRDVADLYRLSSAHVQVALGRAAEPVLPPQTTAAPDGPEIVRATDRLFSAWIAQAQGRLLAEAFAKLQLQLAPLRLAEPAVLQDLAQEWAELTDPDLARAERLALTRAYHRRRVRAAARLADAAFGATPPADL